MRRIVLLAVVALAVPVVAQEAPALVGGASARVVFYGHVFNTGLDFPMPANTQYPWGEADFATSGPIDDTHCGPDTPVGQTANPSSGNPLLEPCDRQANTKLALFTSAGPVQVKQARDFDYAKLHNEFGMTEDVELDTSQSINATLYITPASTHAWLHNPAQTPCVGQDPPENVPCLYPYWRWHAGVAPNFEVKAWLYAMELGDHGANASTRPPVREKLPPLDAANPQSTTDAILVGFGATQPENAVSLDGYGGYPRVHRYDLDLGAPKVATIPRTHNLVLVYSWNEDLSAAEVMADTWRINSGEFFAPSFGLPVKNAFMVERVQPAIVHDRLVVLATLNTPWGSYDVDPGSVRLSIERDGLPVDAPSVVRLADFQVAHGAHYNPINLTWIWDFKADGAKPGAYTVRVGGANYQHTARGENTATFRLTADGRLADVTSIEFDTGELVPAATNATAPPGGNDAPGPGLAALMLALVLAFGLSGRRRR